MNWITDRLWGAASVPVTSGAAATLRKRKREEDEDEDKGVEKKKPELEPEPEPEPEPIAVSESESESESEEQKKDEPAVEEEEEEEAEPAKPEVTREDLEYVRKLSALTSASLLSAGNEQSQLFNRQFEMLLRLVNRAVDGMPNNAQARKEMTAITGQVGRIKRCNSLLLTEYFHTFVGAPFHAQFQTRQFDFLLDPANVEGVFRRVLRQAGGAGSSSSAEQLYKVAMDTFQVLLGAIKHIKEHQEASWASACEHLTNMHRGAYKYHLVTLVRRAKK